MEAILTRSGLWFGAMVLAVLAAANAHDSGFAAQMMIVAVVALAGMWISAMQADVGAIAGSILRMPADPSRYDDDPVRWGVLATVFWAIVGMAVGLLIACQLAWPQLNLEPYLNFGRLRPLHTSGVIFAFGGNILIASSFYVVQRTCRARLAFPGLARFVFWGYQLFIVLAASGYLLGITESREYAEPEWYVDIWLTIVWVAYLVVFVGTLARRIEPHIYVANWFYLSFILTIALLQSSGTSTVSTRGAEAGSRKPAEVCVFIEKIQPELICCGCVSRGFGCDLYPEILEGAGLVLEQRYQRHVNRRTGRRAGEYFEDVLVARR